MVLSEPLHWFISLSFCTSLFPLALFFFGPPSRRSHRRGRRRGLRRPIGRRLSPPIYGWGGGLAVGGGAAAEGDEEIGGSEGAKERRRARGVERRGEGAQLGCSVVRRLAREHPERAPGRPGGRRAGGRTGGDGVRGCGPCVPPRGVRAALICVRGGRAHPLGDEVRS